MIDLRFRPLDNPVPLPEKPARPRWKDISWSQMLDNLEQELWHLEATDIVVEAALPRAKIRNDGWPYSHAVPDSPGVRITFKAHKRGGAELAFECGTFADWLQNLHAIGLTLQRLRLIDEYGATRGQQYRGFAALPPGGIAAVEWASVEDAARFLLVCGGGDPADEHKVVSDVLGRYLDAAWKLAAKRHHPDAGGDAATMARINRAKAYIEQHRGTQR